MGGGEGGHLTRDPAYIIMVILNYVCSCISDHAFNVYVCIGRPSINVITSLRGEIVYTIRPIVHLNRPVKLNFTYQDAESRTIYNRDSQPVEIYNDTNEITYRENRDHVPGECTKCYVTVALTGQIGSQVVQGLSVTSSDTIGK